MYSKISSRSINDNALQICTTRYTNSSAFSISTPFHSHFTFCSLPPPFLNTIIFDLSVFNVTYLSLVEIFSKFSHHIFVTTSFSATNTKSFPTNFVKTSFQISYENIEECRAQGTTLSPAICQSRICHTTTTSCIPFLKKEYQ